MRGQARQLRVFVVMLCGVMSAGGGIEAQHAKPAFGYVLPAEASRLSWADAVNQLKAVCAPAIYDADPPGATSAVRDDLLTVPHVAPVWDDFGEHLRVTEMRGRPDLRGGPTQATPGLLVARVCSRAAAEMLFEDLELVVRRLPGAKPGKQQESLGGRDGVGARLTGRVAVLQSPGQPDDRGIGTFAISLAVSSPDDELSWTGRGGGAGAEALQP
jgi:hypothetical protein